MALKCNGCGNNKAHILRYYSDDKRLNCICDECGSLSVNINQVDVYWEGPGFNRGICDDNGKPIYLESKSHKAKIMKEKGLREAGDMWRGIRGTEFQKVASLNESRMREHKEQVKNAGRIFREGLRKIR